MKNIHLPGSAGERLKLIIIVLFLLLTGCYFVMRIVEGIEKMEVPSLEKSKDIIEKIEYGNKNR